MYQDIDIKSGLTRDKESQEEEKGSFKIFVLSLLNRS